MNFSMLDWIQCGMLVGVCGVPTVSFADETGQGSGTVRDASPLATDLQPPRNDASVSVDSVARNSSIRVSAAPVSVVNAMTDSQISHRSPGLFTLRQHQSAAGPLRWIEEPNLLPTEHHNRLAQLSNTAVGYEQTSREQSNQDQSKSKKSMSQLLDVQSMVGPMNDVATTLSRAEQKTKWNEDSQIIANTTRLPGQESVASTAFTWASPVFHHRPLYFEQPNLERYGNGPCRLVQPVASSAHFLLSVPLMPFKMMYNPPWSDVHTLGEGRPGDAMRSQSLPDVMLDE